MKIKLSKSQWEGIGKKAGWKKEAQGRMDRNEIEQYPSTGRLRDISKGNSNKFILEITLENSEFEDNSASEISRILGVVRDKVERGVRDANILDLNGNSVGFFRVH